MKTAVIGSRNLKFDDIGTYLPAETDEIVSGGAAGIDTCAKEYAKKHNLKYTEFLPEYRRFGRGAPIVRNQMIVDYADNVISFWDGVSRGTAWVIKYCISAGKPCTVIYLKAPLNL